MGQKLDPEYRQAVQIGPVLTDAGLQYLQQLCQRRWGRAMDKFRAHAFSELLSVRIVQGQQPEAETGQQRAMRLWEKDQQVNRSDQELADTLRIIADGKTTTYTFTDEGELATLFGLPVLMIDGSYEDLTKLEKMFGEDTDLAETMSDIRASFHGA